MKAFFFKKLNIQLLRLSYLLGHLTNPSAYLELAFHKQTFLTTAKRSDADRNEECEE